MSAMLADRISVTANDNTAEDLRICGTCILNVPRSIDRDAFGFFICVSHSENAGQAIQCPQISLRALDTVKLWLSLLSIVNVGSC